jgi:hypothetical protein
MDSLIVTDDQSIGVLWIDPKIMIVASRTLETLMLYIGEPTVVRT